MMILHLKITIIPLKMMIIPLKIYVFFCDRLWTRTDARDVATACRQVCFMVFLHFLYCFMLFCTVLG